MNVCRLKKFSLIFALLFCFTAFASCTEVPHGGDDDDDTPPAIYLQAELNRGVLTVTENSQCYSYAIYANGSEIAVTAQTEIDIAKVIIDEYPYSYNDDWSIEVEGLNSDGVAVIATEEAIDFSIRALNTDNFVSVLSSNYDVKDYFVLEEDVNLYGIDETLSAQAEPPQGYLTCKLVYATGSIRNFINKPLTACLDGNGYTLNVLVDKRMAFRADALLGLGGVFDTVESTGEIKNTVINIDVLYEQLGGWYTGPLVYQGFYGSMKNCFVNATLRPVIAYRTSADYNSKPIEYDADERAGILGVVKDASISDCIFKLNVLGHDNARYDYGGVIGLMAGTEEKNSFKNCVFIRDSETPTFINDGWTWAHNGNGKASADNLSYYTSLENFLTGTNGYVFSGVYDKDSSYQEKTGAAYLNFSSEWEINSDCIKLLDKTITVGE